MGLNITGNKYNRLTAIKFSHKEGHQNRAKWLFKCECGNKKIIDKGKVTGGYTRSCGCLLEEERKRFTERSTTHGLSGGRKRTSEYMVWLSMRKRCLKPNDAGYKDYGGRGIKVCKRWLDSFPNFLEDMGDKPTKEHSIDRIDNDGNYEPSNCRWATRLQQGRNKRGVRLITIDGKTKCLAEWVEFLGLDQDEVNRDLYERKLDIKQALYLSKSK